MVRGTSSLVGRSALSRPPYWNAPMPRCVDLTGSVAVLLVLPGAVAHQPVLMRPGQGPEAEEDDQQAARDAHAALAQPPSQARRGQSGGQQYRPGAQAEGQHEQGTVQRVALAGGPQQGAVDQPAGQPAPQGAQGRRLGQAMHRHEASGHRLDETPQALAQGLDARQTAPPAGQIQPHGDQQQGGDDAQYASGRAAGQRPAAQAEQQPGDGVAEDATEVVAEQQLQAPAALLRRDGQGQRAHQAAAHAQAVAAAQQ